MSFKKERILINLAHIPYSHCIPDFLADIQTNLRERGCDRTLMEAVVPNLKKT